MTSLSSVNCKVGQVVECIQLESHITPMLKLGAHYTIVSIDSPLIGVMLPHLGKVYNFYASRFKLVTDPLLQPSEDSAVPRPRFGKSQSLVGPYTSEGKITINDLMRRNG